MRCRTSPHPSGRARICYLGILLLLAGAITGSGQNITETGPEPHLPLADWILEGERDDFDWDVDLDRPTLRMDQRFEIALTARVENGDLPETEADHHLTFATVVTDRDGTWLGASEPESKLLDRDLNEESAVEFESYVSLIPGKYIMWVILHDETTGGRNVERRETEVDAIGGDPLPQAYVNFPVVEFAELEYVGTLRVRQFESDLSIPVSSDRRLDVELIATLSAPEQWPGGTAISRHTENVLGGLTALSELDLENGFVSVTGLDLIRREVVFEREEATELEKLALVEAFETVNRSAISVGALMDRSDNAAFLRRFLENRVAEHTGEPSLAPPLRILILVAGVMRFEDDPDLSEVRLEGPCDCRVYHLRFKQQLQDLFDQVDDLLEPFDPPTFDIVTPRDFRKVIGEIVRDLEEY